jgi:hypothetical protein
MNIDAFLKDINTYKDFKLLIDLVIQNTLLLCYKNTKDAALINSDKQSLLEYYQREKNKIIDNINSYAKVFKIEFKNTGITFNEDYTSYLDEIKEIYFNDKQSGFKINRDDTRGLLIYFNEIKTSIWIAFYNSKIQELKKQLNNSKVVHHIFYNDGFEYFEYLAKTYKKGTPTIKLTAIYNVLLRFEKIRENQNLFMDFVTEKFSKELEKGNKTLKFNRFADTSADSYTDAYDDLLLIMQTKLETPKN